MAFLICDDLGRPRHGAFPPLENKANILLEDDRRGVKTMRLLNDWFTEDQWKNRHSHEVFSDHPIEAALYRGQFSRAHHNRPHRPVSRHRFALWMDPWQQDQYEFFDRIPPLWMTSWSM